MDISRIQFQIAAGDDGVINEKFRNVGSNFLQLRHMCGIVFRVEITCIPELLYGRLIPRQFLIWNSQTKIALPWLTALLTVLF